MTSTVAPHDTPPPPQIQQPQPHSNSTNSQAQSQSQPQARSQSQQQQQQQQQPNAQQQQQFPQQLPQQQLQQKALQPPQQQQQQQALPLPQSQTSHQQQPSQPRPTPHSQPQQHPHPPPPQLQAVLPHPPTPTSQAASPPSKRDLKSWWKGFKIPSKHQDTQEPRPHGIFGVPLRQSITYANVAISLIDENGKSYIYGYVPIVVAKCGVFLKEKATGVEGIFRLSGSEKRIKELKTLFDSPDRYGKGLVWDGYTVHDAANVLRRYLNDLPEPVVPLDLYEKFREPLRGATMQAVGDAEGPQFVENFDLDAAIATYQQLITELPPLNRQLLLYILDLLAVFAAKSDENRMNSQNLAAIFQPGMLSHPTHAMAPEEYRLNQCVIIFLIENQDHFLIGMQGTAADEKTVQEVQKGTPPTTTPVTPQASRKSGSGVHRSASNASAGAESVARDGTIRRNRSTSSRHSRHSNGAPSPSSPALVPTSGGGLARSNTVPSKKSPAIGSGRFHKKVDQSGGNAIGPLTPATPTPIPPTPTAEDAAVLGTPREKQQRLTASGTSAAVAASAALLSAGQLGPAGRSQEGLLEPITPEALTPARERKLQSLFQRSPTSESDPRQPNKLRKKRLASSTNPSAQSSTASLPHSMVGLSPGAELANPMEYYHQPLDASAQTSGTSPASAIETPSELTPRASQPPTGNSLHPGSAEHIPNNNTLRPSKSPPQSLHSSFNEGSDLDQFDEPPPAVAEQSEPDKEKEKKRRWRLSRKKEDMTPPPVTPSYPPGGPASPRKVLGANMNADVSSSSIGSGLGGGGGGRPGRRSFNGNGGGGGGGFGVETGSYDPSTTLTTSASVEAPSSHDSAASFGKEGREGGDASKGLTGWIKNKYREAKENHDQRRNKSPPAADDSSRGAAVGSAATSLGSTGFLPSGGGKSLDIKRSVEEDKMR